ncbi:YiiX/YebB-like N1pC/P60 family cysteine hydrolase [Zunongwangia pacifica]|uniref:Permuted papain-like amidase YaeF/Yiix C92 family enzyme n=1 Tax=Zunongwangia pacifica TaxID=2911062 RepID=A0A9X2CMP0_9FLAO|nr:YiiX/YebB-like N1pC/P60 family cysteine hydrolase [Zunongwangia pacifica]MCL6217739.1 hypothetical protein [Zunongwangia pacifica]
MWNLKNNFIYFFFIIFCVQCHSPKKKEVAIDYENIHTGNLVCRLGNGYFSDFFRKYASSEKKYSHIGIISKENNIIYVFHTEANELTGSGKVKKERLDSFLNGIETFDFFETIFNTHTNLEIVNTVKDYYKKETPFDIDFNTDNDHELYCSELIAVSINKTIGKEIIKPTLILNKKKYFSLDDIYLNSEIIKKH